MIAPTLLVGLGGTGSKIIIRVSQNVKEYLRKRLRYTEYNTKIIEIKTIRKKNKIMVLSVVQLQIVWQLQ